MKRNIFFLMMFMCCPTHGMLQKKLFKLYKFLPGKKSYSSKIACLIPPKLPSTLYCDAITPNLATKADDSCIKNKVTCVRPYREILNLADRKTGNKLIIDNYGHGGSGWSLLPGAVDYSVQLLKEKCRTDKNVAVVGAGCYGLLTALWLKNEGYSVRIIAEHCEDLPSHKAGGRWAVLLSQMDGKYDLDFLRTLACSAYKQYLYFAYFQAGRGVRLVPTYLQGNPGKMGIWPLLGQKLIEKPSLVTVNFGSVQRSLVETKSIFMDVQVLMDLFHAKIEERDIELVSQKVDKLEKLEESIIFNCAGLGARELVDDSKLMPVQGHVLELQNQPTGLDYMISVEHEYNGEVRDLYYMPKNYVSQGNGVLGGTFIPHEERLNTNQEEFEKIIKTARNYFYGE